MPHKFFCLQGWNFDSLIKLNIWWACYEIVPDGSVMRIWESVTCESYNHDRLGFDAQDSGTYDRLLGLTKCIEALIEPMNCQKWYKAATRCNGSYSRQTESWNSIFITIIEGNQNKTR